MAAAAGFIGGAKVVPGKEWGAAYDEAMRMKVFGAARDDDDDLRLHEGLEGRRRPPHGDDVDGKVTRARMDLNYSVFPSARPEASGRAHASSRSTSRWSWPRDAPEREAARLGGEPRRAVQAERRRGRRRDVRDGPVRGPPVRRHGGPPRRRPRGLPQRHDLLPEYEAGAVILTNADSGVMIRGPLLRRLLEVLFDGKPEAGGDAEVGAKQRKAAIAKERERLVVPADPAAAATLARAT